MYISKINYLNFQSDKKQAKIGKSRLDFYENHDIKEDEVTIIDKKLAIGRAPGSPQYPQVGDANPNNYTYDFHTILRDIEFLNTHFNVDTVIDLRNPKYEGNTFASAEADACELKGVNYFNIPLDSGIAPTKEEVEKLLEIINKSKNRVYIHCHAGRDRTGIMTSCYLAKTSRKTQKEAFKQVFEDRKITPLKYMYGQPEECKKLSALLIDLAKKQ